MKRLLIILFFSLLLSSCIKTEYGDNIYGTWSKYSSNCPWSTMVIHHRNYCTVDGATVYYRIQGTTMQLKTTDIDAKLIEYRVTRSNSNTLRFEHVNEAGQLDKPFLMVNVEKVKSPF